MISTLPSWTSFGCTKLISSISSRFKNKKVNNNKDIVEGSIDENQKDQNGKDS